MRFEPEGSLELGSEAPAASAEYVLGAINVRRQTYHQQRWGPLPDQQPDLLQTGWTRRDVDCLEGMSDAQRQFAHRDSHTSRPEVERQDRPRGPAAQR